VNLAFEAGYVFARSDDFTHFDASITSPASDAEYAFYDAVTPLTFTERKQLLGQVTCCLRSSFAVKYRKPQGRNSGDSNTSLGNTILNGMIKSVVLAGEDCLIFVSGDDTMILSKAPLHITDEQYQAFFPPLGFEIRTKTSHIFAATFLSGRFARVGLASTASDIAHNSLVLVPLIGKCLAKLFWSVADTSSTAPCEVRAAILEAARIVFAGDQYATAYFNGMSHVEAKPDYSALSYFFRVCLDEDDGVSVTPTDTLEEYQVRYGSSVALQLVTALHSGPHLINPLQIPLRVLEIDAGL
jgi:hypothetical protein